MEPMTICAHCKYHNKTGPQDVWYNNLCGNKDFAIKQHQDPVTGLIIPTDTRPYCRDINKGNCFGFQKN